MSVDLHDPRQWVVGDVLRRQARSRGDRVCVHSAGVSADTWDRLQHT